MSIQYQKSSYTSLIIRPSVGLYCMSSGEHTVRTELDIMFIALWN